MGKYVLKRLFQMLFVLIGVSFMIYFIMDLAPGDLATTILGDEALEEDIDALREELGLNQPIVVRYVRYMWNLLHGNMGYSYKYKETVWKLYSDRLPLTLLLSLTSTIVGTLLSLPLGIYAALKRGTIQDNFLSALAIVGLATPNFWVGLMLILLFSLKLGWFNSGNYASLKDIVLPAITSGTAHMALVTRTTRSSMLDVLRQDYLMLARAKGVPERKVITKYAFKNALIPIITVVGMQFSAGIAGATITESVFNLPGVGQLVVNAIKSQDVETVTGCIIMIALISSSILLLVDLLYAFVDPRIKAKYSKAR